MAEELILDFSGAPPSAGPQSDHIPPGSYVLKVEMAELTQTKKQKPMIVVDLSVSRGPFTGKRLRDYFTIPESATDTLVGLQRLNSLLVAVRGKEAKGRTKSANLIAAITGKELLADVDDKELAAQAGYDTPLTVSNIVAYHFPKSDAGKARIEAMRSGAQTTPAADAPAQAPAAEAPADDGLENIDEPAAAEATADEPATTSDDELENLFD